MGFSDLTPENTVEDAEGDVTNVTDGRLHVLTKKNLEQQTETLAVMRGISRRLDKLILLMAEVFDVEPEDGL